MSGSNGFDCVVIGAGHNGLIAAAYLAQAGRRVCVVERRDVLGGCSVTEALWPGYKVSTASYVVSLLLPEIIRDLRLKENGLEILPRQPSSFTPTSDGRYLLMGADASLNQREIAKFSARDAEAYPRYEALLERVAANIEPALSQPAPDIVPMPKSWRRRSWLRRASQMRRALPLVSAAKRMGDHLPEAVELLVGAARPILDRWFESQILKATLATDAIIGAFASISAPGTAYVLLHHVMGTAGGARGVWGYIRGGMGGLAESLARVCRDLGVQILTDAEVRAINVVDGQARGVTLTSGRVVDARVVASSVDANLTFLKFLQASDLPGSFREAIRRIDYSSASAKINLALGELPDFTCLPSQNGPAPHHRGTIHICDELDWIERAYDDAKYGRPSEKPVIEMTIPSSVDETLAPAGRYVVSMFVQFAPYKLADGLEWDKIKESFADRCIELVGRFAPNFPQAIEHRQVLSPLDLERTFGLTGGNIFQGAMTLHQLMSMRPVPGWADHHTPVKGLFLCGAATHPGGGVLGACGRNAAREILRTGR